MLEALFALLIAMVLAGALVGFARPRMVGGGDGAAMAVGSLFLFFFLILFLASWAGGLWLVPFGPLAWEVSWLPMVAVGLFVALLLAAAAASSDRYPGSIGSVDRDTTAAAAAIVFGVFFWILVVALLAAIGSGYMID